MKYGMLATCFVALISTHAAATDKKGGFAIKGVGNVPCHAYQKLVYEDDPQKYLFAGWLNGYITAQNQHLENTFDIASWEDIETLGNYLYHHCKTNPDQSFYQAATLLVSSLYDNRIVQYEGAENLSSGKQGVMVYRQVIVRMQEALKNKGYFSGEADGKVSDSFTQAVSEFQNANGVQATQMFDQRLLHALFRAE